MQRSIAGRLPNTGAKAGRTESRRWTTAERCCTRGSERFASVVLRRHRVRTQHRRQDRRYQPHSRRYCVGAGVWDLPPVGADRQAMVTTAVLRRWVSAARVTGPQPRGPAKSDCTDHRRGRQTTRMTAGLPPGAGTSIHPWRCGARSDRSGHARVPFIPLLRRCGGRRYSQHRVRSTARHASRGRA